MWNRESYNINELLKEMRQNNIRAAKRKSLFNCRTKQETLARWRPDTDAERRMSSRKWDSLDARKLNYNKYSPIYKSLPVVNTEAASTASLQ